MSDTDLIAGLESEVARLLAERELLIAAGVRLMERLDPNAIASGRATEDGLRCEFLELAGVQP